MLDEWCCDTGQTGTVYSFGYNSGGYGNIVFTITADMNIISGNSDFYNTGLLDFKTCDDPCTKGTFFPEMLYKYLQISTAILH